MIAGSAKGQKLQLVPGDKTRPISDRVKESLFNIIREDLQGAHFLDLFSGTGSVGIEALSRGAAHVTFVDNQRAAIQTLENNLTSTKLKKNAKVIMGDSFAYFAKRSAEKYDYVFIAPPQYKGLWLKALERVNEHPENLVTDAWVIVQIDKREYQPMKLKNLEEFDQRKYSSTMLVFYERKAFDT